jgi:hypothetical protein
MRCAVPPNWRQSYFITSQAALPNWQRVLKSHETSCIFQLVARAKCHNKSNLFTFKLIVGFIQKFQSQLQQDLVNLSLSHAFSIAKLDSISIKAKSNSAMLIDSPTSQQSTLLYFNGGSSRLIVEYIHSLNSEGARSLPTTFMITQALNCQKADCCVHQRQNTIQFLR